MSNFEVLKHARKNRPSMLKRVRQLENTARQLREYSSRCPRSKRMLVLYKAVQYEHLAENIIHKLEITGA